MPYIQIWRPRTAAMTARYGRNVTRTLSRIERWGSREGLEHPQPWTPSGIERWGSREGLEHPQPWSCTWSRHMPSAELACSLLAGCGACRASAAALARYSTLLEKPSNPPTSLMVPGSPLHLPALIFKLFLCSWRVVVSYFFLNNGRLARGTCSL